MPEAAPRVFESKMTAIKNTNLSCIRYDSEVTRANVSRFSNGYELCLLFAIHAMFIVFGMTTTFVLS